MHVVLFPFFIFELIPCSLRTQVELATMACILTSNTMSAPLLRARLQALRSIEAKRDASHVDVAVDLKARADFFNQRRRIWEPVLEPFNVLATLKQECRHEPSPGWSEDAEGERTASKASDLIQVDVAVSALNLIMSTPFTQLLMSDALRIDRVTTGADSLAPYLVRNASGVAIIVTLACGDGGEGVMHMLGDGEEVR